MKKTKLQAFTLIEVLLSTVLISSILTAAFFGLTYISVAKIRLVETTKIEKEGFYFSEKLFEMIKLGGEVDFEEYFNRKIVGNSGATAFSSGHFSIPTGFGNFGYGGNVENVTNVSDYGGTIYYCVSPIGTVMGTGGCISTNNSAALDHNLQPQRYGEYATQFIDYNSDFDDDTTQCGGSAPLGDEDCNGSFIGDDDDRFIGRGPDVYNTNENVHELYLLSGDASKRTFFRWNVTEDPDRPSGVNCDFSDQSAPVGDGCLGTIEFIELDARDWGTDHDIATIDTNGSQYDGITDTWIVNSRFAGNTTTIAASDTTNYWEKLFPNSISVSDFEIYAYPHKDIRLAWKDSNSSINQSPYIRLKLKLTPSRKKRTTIAGKVPEVEIATTISLSNEFSQ